jgi:hypothetical protein
MKILMAGWFIMALILLSYLQYSHPDTFNSLVGKIWDPVSNFIEGINPFKGNTQSNGACPDTINKVCGDNGVTYDNTCKAMLAGVTNVTSGAC